MNPPFSAAPNVTGRVADAALRHLRSALARLAEGGRLVAITGESLAPDNPAWRDAFTALQARGRVVFSAGIDGRLYARHGARVATRLTVIDRAPAEDPARFPDSPGTADSAATLLDWVTRLVPPRRPAAAAGAAPSSANAASLTPHVRSLVQSRAAPARCTRRARSRSRRARLRDTGLVA